MQVVNAVFRGDLEMKVDLVEIHKNVPNSVLHTKRPSTVVVKDAESTIMIFPSGKFRIMGMVDELDATFKVYELFAKLNFEFPPITLQTMTVKLKFNPVNLYSLSALIKSQLNLEIFPALMITKYKPVSVNVFASGAVMICGVKDLSIVNEIEQDLKLII